MDQEQVAYLFRQYGLVSARWSMPAAGLLGVVTVDDIVNVIDEEAEEDCSGLAASARPDSTPRRSPPPSAGPLAAGDPGQHLSPRP